MKVLLLASSFSGLCQRVVRGLIIDGHRVEQHYGMDAPRLRDQIASFNPELIVCPYLTHRIPEDIWRARPCLVVHPGIEGDRGPSSLDWAIACDWSRWGVTLLQADAQMDAGNIWGTAEFPLRPAGKTSIYKREVTGAAVRLIRQALKDSTSSDFRPRPLDYGNGLVRGTLLSAMTQSDRSIDWRCDPTRAVLRKIRAADTFPGVLDRLLGHEVFLYGAIEEPALRGTPGELLSLSQGAACIGTVDGAVWIRQMKCQHHPELPAIKLPAAHVIGTLAPADMTARMRAVGGKAPNDIRVELRGSAAYLYFDFYNGAANTEQCLRLRDSLRALKRLPGVKTLVLMGGEDFFSNGIHLNCIEAAASPADESWANINAIDDVVLEIIKSPDHLTVAALRNNAGAGGAILPLACDRVAIREGVVLNPHYGNMGLYGSEFWTYLLPKRVGEARATDIARECQPMLASEALELGMADRLFEEDWDIWHRRLDAWVEELCVDAHHARTLGKKRARRAADEAVKPLAFYRRDELEMMHAIFYDPAARYHRERKRFVHKGKLPQGEPSDVDRGLPAEAEQGGNAVVEAQLTRVVPC